MRLLETQHTRIPWRAVFLLVMIGVALNVGLFSAGGMIFTMRKYISSPVLINSIGSLDVLFNILVAATCLYISDRTWTRHGRRKIFIAPAWLLMAVCLFFLPLSQTAWSVALLVVLWFILLDAATAFQVLQMEIVPPDQRGRFVAINQWVLQIFMIVWSVVVGGRFDDIIIQNGSMLSGERFTYWMGAGAIAVAAVCLWFFVHERPPAAPPPATAGTGGLRAVWQNVFGERALWPVYLLVFSETLLSTGLGAIDPLLFTEQWGYSKQDMGTNIFVGGVINLFFIPVVGWLVDRMDRMKMFAIGVVGALVFHLAYYLFIQFILPDRRPEIYQMIFFGQIMSMFGQFSTIAYTPLMFDYIPRNKMGTSQAGRNFVSSITKLVTLNGIGLWVAGYSHLFSPPGTYNYLSGYQFMLLMNLIGCGFLLYFAIQVKRGRIKPVGILADSAAPSDEKSVSSPA